MASVSNFPPCYAAAVQGEVLLAAGDRPPAIGVHVYHSTDGGEHWQDITDAAFAPDGQCAEVGRQAGGWS